MWQSGAIVGLIAGIVASNKGLVFKRNRISQFDTGSVPSRIGMATLTLNHDV